ncbi:MAG TPA: DUF4411 family protein [Gammaproteobacteria bacterium]|nr:DUF4411 family protein [Gammaproteobacteria bacterium]
MSYLLDANVFIQAKNLHYGLDFCPAFWQWLIEQNRTGKVFSIEKVGDEIQAGDDDLSDWAKDRDSDFFLNPDAAVLQSLGEVSQWATGNGYEATAITTFFQVADYYLVAHALANGTTVVTHEIPSNSVKKVKIPNACIGTDVKFMSPYEMLRHEQARFVLGTNQ